MVVRWTTILGLVALVAVPIACGGRSVSTLDGDAGPPGDGGTSGAGGTGGRGGSSSGGTNATGGAGGTGGGVLPGTGGVPGTGGSVNPTGGAGGSGAFGGSGNVGAVGAFGGGDTSGGTGPVAGTGGLPSGPPLPWDDAGYISIDNNAYGIHGSWFFVTDCEAAMSEGLSCTVPDSGLVGPDMMPGWSTTKERVCARGVATQVGIDSTGMPAYAFQWGALLGFELAGTGAADGTSGPYDAESLGIRGFMFDISGSRPPSIRISFVTEQTEESAHFVEVTLPAPSQPVLFADALQGNWVTMPVPLDTSALTSVTFQVYTSTAAPKPFDFCISNARILFW